MFLECKHSRYFTVIMILRCCGYPIYRIWPNCIYLRYPINFMRRIFHTFLFSSLRNSMRSVIWYLFWSTFGIFSNLWKRTEAKWENSVVEKQRRNATGSSRSFGISNFDYTYSNICSFQLNLFTWSQTQRSFHPQMTVGCQ